MNQKEINAFALPGGFIYVNRGLIEAAETQDELAGVLAHEIGHVVARHGADQAMRDRAPQERRFENVRLRRDAVLGADPLDGRVEIVAHDLAQPLGDLGHTGLLQGREESRRNERRASRNPADSEYGAQRLWDGGPARA